MRARPSDLVRLTLTSGIAFYLPRTSVGDITRTRGGANVKVGGKSIAVLESYAELAESVQPNRFGLSGKKGTVDAGKLGG